MSADVCFQDPALPTVDSIRTIEDQGFSERVLAVLASVATFDGRVLEDKIRMYIEAASSLLHVRWQDPIVQLRALGLLADPPPAEQAIKHLESGVASSKVSREARIRAGDTVLCILEGTPQTVAGRRELATRVLDALQDRDPEHMRRLEALGDDPPGSGGAGGIRALFGASVAGNEWALTREARTNGAARRTCERVSWLARELGDEELDDTVDTVASLLHDRPYRIVLVGEIKHGKSCLFNAMAGDLYSPVGESSATTAAVVELVHGSDVAFSGSWFDAKRSAEILAFAKDHGAENEFTRQWAEAFESTLRMPWFEYGGAIPSVTTIEELREYLATDGEFAWAVQRVRIEMPIEALRSGAVLCDTPGLNDPIRPREGIALEEALKADCICFVLNAEKLGTESERRFLEQLSKGGRAVFLMPVLTRLDALSSDEAREAAVEGARQFVEGSVKGSPVVVRDVLPVHGARAMEESVRNAGRPSSDSSELARLQRAIAGAVQDPTRSEHYEKRIEDALARLEGQASAAVGRWAAAHEARIPDERALTEQMGLAEHLRVLAEHYRSHIMRQLDAHRERLLSEHEAYLERIVNLEDEVIVGVGAAIDAELQRTKLRDKAAWDRFDEDVRRRIVEPAIRRFEREQAGNITRWEADVQVFQGQVQDDLREALEKLEVDLGKLEGITAAQARGVGTLLEVKELVDTINRRSFGVIAGAGAGVAATGGAAGLIGGVTALAAGMMGAAPVVLVAGAVAGAAWIAMSMMSMEKQRKKLIALKIDVARKTLRSALEDKPTVHEAILQRVWATITNLAVAHYAPVIGTALAMAERARVQRQLWERARADGRALADELGSAGMGLSV